MQPGSVNSAAFFETVNLTILVLPLFVPSLLVLSLLVPSRLVGSVGVETSELLLDAAVLFVAVSFFAAFL